MSRQDKPKSAVGIKYQADNKQQAPTVVAKGFGDLADEIVELAREHGVLIHEDEHLAGFLTSLDLGQEIPRELYVVIAELIAFSYVLQGKFPDSWTNKHGKVDDRA
ncbi:EscU/YscU/HrcU family type III secretion system export apparatus switch protein [Bowmanella dokdonensis]|uniref:Flagellar biosynthetic protein FlhB n=1 Tax=Bowmanella dokdonensis TaxID=751969 RepID=A0A939DPE1_9ALTE|nr:EscU/YscU/HrcU family type III secretion system export apparatus switch protein [Bowmanella dokdonensis]MBN7826325.1 EscU/YscU/HrcU family type III secretion system export apparatus switch protein [Bowmanella dokdonensis]